MDNKTHLSILWDTKLKNCVKCKLSSTRTQVVPGEGIADTQIMFIGQNPGFNEDQQGKPFVGESGIKLNELISKLGLIRENLYITNAIKCFTPANRKPELDEIKACSSYIDFEIRTIKPKVIIALGDPAIPTLTGFTGTVTKAMDSNLSYVLKYSSENGSTKIEYVPVIACYHPSYLSRNEHSNLLDICAKIISVRLKKYL